MKMLTSSSTYLQNRILSGPLDVIFTLLIFILSISLHATPFQLMLIACLKPITSLISYYVSTLLHGKSYRIRSYLMANICIGCLPCLLYPFVDNVWFYIVSYGIFKVAKRAEEPAWIELLKQNLALSTMSTLVSRGTSITYFISMALPPILSFWLDESWRVLFFLLAVLQLLSLVSIYFMKSDAGDLKVHFTEKQKSAENALTVDHANRATEKGALKRFLEPFQSGLQLLRSNPSFGHYLFLYFLGGAGIVMIHPILPVYFNEELGLSYQQLTLAFSVCKGISFLISSPIWAKYVNDISLYRLNAYMNVFTCLFVGGVLGATFGVEWLYVGYLCYGTMQGGCELSWNMSGPIFSKKNDSTAFSSLNLLLVGVRGCICPFLGFLIFTFGGFIPVFISTIALCLIGIVYGLWLDNKYAAELKPAVV